MQHYRSLSYLSSFTFISLSPAVRMLISNNINIFIYLVCSIIHAKLFHIYNTHTIIKTNLLTEVQGFFAISFNLRL